MKKTLKFLCLIFIIFLLSITLIACSNDAENNENSTPKEDPKEEVSFDVAALKGPTGMGMAKLMEDVETGSSNLKSTFTLAGTPDELVGKVVNGEFDFACVPSNLASVLYNKTEGKIQLAAVNTLGVLYVLENGDTIHSIEDLKGKKVYVSGQGATPEYAIKYLLEKNNLDPEKDVELDYSMQHAELATAVAAGDVPIALLPQPHVTSATMQNKDIRIAIDLTEEWKKVDESQLAMGAILVQKEFAENNKEVVDQFLEEYKTSVQWVNANPEEAGTLMEKFEILPKAKIAEMAIPNSSIVYMDGAEAKNALNGFYKVLFDFNPKSLGGKLPDENFYYKK